MLLKGKLALVTGSSRGIGAAIAKGFAAEGAIVIVNYNRSRKRGEEVLAEVRKCSPESMLLKFDVSDKLEVEKAIDTVIDRFKRVDILVNNAGIVKESDFMDIEDSVIDNVFGVNIKGNIYCMQQVAKAMISRNSGSIINVSSISQFSPFYNSVPYAMSKSAVKMLTRCTALELSKHNIRVNSIIPGIISSEIVEGYKDEALMERMQKIIPLNKIGEPRDVVGSALFLASDLSSYVTGIDILIDGGFSLFKNKNPKE